MVHCTIPHRYLCSAIGSPVHHHSYRIRHKFLHLMICLCCCHWFTLHQLCISSRIQTIYDLDSDSCTESGRLQTCKSSNIQKSKHDSKPPSMTQDHSHVDQYLVYKFFYRGFGILLLTADRSTTFKSLGRAAMISCMYMHQQQKVRKPHSLKFETSHCEYMHNIANPSFKRRSVIMISLGWFHEEGNKRQHQLLRSLHP